MQQHPAIGERVLLRPTNPSVPVQRAEGIYGQFLPPAGQEVIFDEFHLRRLAEGSVAWEPIPKTPAAPIGDPLPSAEEVR